jgi:hypothetical protein
LLANGNEFTLTAESKGSATFLGIAQDSGEVVHVYHATSKRERLGTFVSNVRGEKENGDVGNCGAQGLLMMYKMSEKTMAMRTVPSIGSMVGSALWNDRKNVLQTEFNAVYSLRQGRDKWSI